MRKLSHKPLFGSFIDGLYRGMASSDDVFEIEMFITSADRFEGLRHDRDVLRGDVERAKAKFDYHAKSGKGRVAAG